jgi:hypothetical protein
MLIDNCVVTWYHRCDLRDVPIEDLERALGEDWVDEPVLWDTGADEMNEYERFLRVRSTWACFYFVYHILIGIMRMAWHSRRQPVTSVMESASCSEARAPTLVMAQV